MSKRHFDNENKENQPEQSLLSSSTSSLLLKPTDTNEPTPAKRAKLTDTEHNENGSGQTLLSASTGPLLLQPIDTNEPTPAKRAKLTNTENDEELDLSSDDEEEDFDQEPLPSSDDDDDDEVDYDRDTDDEDNDDDDADDEDEDEEEQRGPWPISAVIENNDGTIYPQNKQYFIYENTKPNLVSKTARFWSRKYLKVLRHVDPDSYNMYIHNDFVSYGELEILENCLLEIAKGTFIKFDSRMNFTNYITAFRRLEALNILLDRTDNFPGIDDGSRFAEIMRVIGACYVSILSGLLPKAMFEEGSVTYDEKKFLKRISHHLPNFQEVILRALLLGRNFLSIGFVPTAYTRILQIVYCNWSFVMNEKRIDLNEKPDKQDKEIWKILKAAAKIKRHTFKESFNFLRELQSYSENHPGLGGTSHDLRKWSKTRRDQFLFDKMDDDNQSDRNFWFQL